MGRFERGNRGGYRSERRQTTMHPAVCDKCGRDCKVPFKPTGDKPVYCSNCFEREDNRNSDRFERRGGGDRRDRDRDRNRDNKSCSCNGQIEKLDTIIEKLDRILSALEAKNVPEVEKKAVKKKTVKKKKVAKEKK